jgi:receptor protein-tyrosine kinase
MNQIPPAQSFVVQELRDKAHTTVPDRSIGAILIKLGRLSVADAERVMRFQIERGVRFGDAALALGVLTESDIEFALSRQYDYPYLVRGESKISEDVVAAYEPFTSRVESLRALRNQLMLRWFDTGEERRVLAVTSAERGDGRSFLAANLAVVFSQQGQRTLLIDADLRNPRQHEIFSLENRIGLSSILSGRNGAEAVQKVDALENLAVLTAGAPPPNPSELLGRPSLGKLLGELVTQYDVILMDTPAGEECSDAQMVAGRAGAAIVVTRQNISHVNLVGDLIASLAETRAQLVGSVLNNF